jgi:hypothetical protein
MTKSPKAVLEQALRVARDAVPAYASRTSRKDFTQYQHVAILALKTFLKLDYRGVAALLADCGELRDTLGLTKGPPLFHPVQGPAAAPQKRGFQRLQQHVFPCAHARALIPDRPEAAVDATGLESRYTSYSFVRRQGKRRRSRRYTKLTVACHTQTHLLASAVVSTGPGNDSPQFAETVRGARRHTAWDRLLADAAFDAEHHHRLCREELGIRSTVIPLNKRGQGRKWPKTRYRRQMKRRFHRRRYGQRWQVESAFSRHKRLLGAAGPLRRVARARVLPPRVHP